MSNFVPVSVVIPCWRCVDTVARALDSVAAQSIHPCEVIIIDDASGGETLIRLNQIVGNYADGWIKVVATDVNGGPGFARNIGWACSRGKYIAFLDADDAWSSEKIRIQYDWMCEHDDVVLTGHRSARYFFRDSHVNDVYSIKSMSISPKCLLFRNVFQTRTVMIKKDILFRFDPLFRRAEDYHLWLRIVLSGYSAWIIDVPLALTFKEDFGESGLSASMWKMQLAELGVFNDLRKKKFISLFYYVLASVWSVAKYFRRVVICKFLRHL